VIEPGQVGGGRQQKAHKAEQEDAVFCFYFMEVFSHVKNPCFFLIIQLKNHTAENMQLNTYG
jgi:hypothetical protein